MSAKVVDLNAKRKEKKKGKSSRFWLGAFVGAGATVAAIMAYRAIRGDGDSSSADGDAKSAREKLLAAALAPPVMAPTTKRRSTKKARIEEVEEGLGV